MTPAVETMSTTKLIKVIHPKTVLSFVGSIVVLVRVICVLGGLFLAKPKAFTILEGIGCEPNRLESLPYCPACSWVNIVTECKMLDGVA
jgi:hypothetical protein